MRTRNDIDPNATYAAFTRHGTRVVARFARMLVGADVLAMYAWLGDSVCDARYAFAQVTR